MISLFYIAFLVSVTSLPIRLLPKRNVNQSLVSLRSSAAIKKRCPHYWLTGNNIPSGQLFRSNHCGDGMLAMPKTSFEWECITTMLGAQDSAEYVLNTETWNGKYAWLGGEKDDADNQDFKWLDGTPVQMPHDDNMGGVIRNNWDVNEPGTSTSCNTDPCPLSYQRYMGVVRKNVNGQGKFHDFHGRDQNNNGQEATVGQPALCQEKPHYWVTAAGIPSNDVKPPAQTNVCGEGNSLAMPKTSAEQERVRDVISSLPSGPSGLAWGGSYVWLGGWQGHWNDGTEVNANWDVNEPGTSGSCNEGESCPLSYQPFFGMKRSNGKFHDFHGQDQSDQGKEASVGQLALCQGYPKYWTFGPVSSDALCNPVPCSDSLWVDPCDASDGVMAQPQSLSDWSDACDAANSFPMGGAWGGSYLWLGGGCDSGGNWAWSDGTPIAVGDSRWDTNQPGTSGGEPFFGMKRSNGKWHDFNGNGVERSTGQYVLCQERP